MDVSSMHHGYVANNNFSCLQYRGSGGTAIVLMCLFGSHDFAVCVTTYNAVRDAFAYQSHFQD